MAFKFERFKWTATMDGFNYLVDVYNDTVYLGMLEAKPDGFIIKVIDTPTEKITIKKSSNNKFKTEGQAAETLLRTWQKIRQGDQSALT